MSTPADLPGAPEPQPPLDAAGAAKPGLGRAARPETSARAVLGRLARNAMTLTAAQFAAAALGSDPEAPSDVWVFASANGVELSTRQRRTRQSPRALLAQLPVANLLTAPIQYGGRTLGTLSLASEPGSADFTEQDRLLVDMLTDLAGVALHAAQLFGAGEARRAWLQAVIDQMPEGIVLIDADGHLTLQDQSMFALSLPASEARDRFGNRAAVDLRRPAGEPLAPDELPIVAAMVDDAVIPPREFEGRDVDGHPVPLLVSAGPIHDAGGALVGATMILQDVSMLKALEHRREEWALLVAHDLQQPISAILLRTGLLLHERLTATQRDDLRDVRNAVRRLSRMVNDLMDASQLESKRMHVAFSRIDIARLVRDVTSRAPDLAPFTRIEAPVNAAMFVNGDAQRLEQIVTNLLSNAVKYGTPRTQIGVVVRDLAGQAEIAVSNRGPGIPPRELPLLFDRYVRTRAARHSRVKGLGLGLYIAKGLVEAHGGRIWAESTPSETTFRFTVPLDAAGGAAASPPSSGASPTKPTGAG